MTHARDHDGEDQVGADKDHESIHSPSIDRQHVFDKVFCDASFCRLFARGQLVQFAALFNIPCVWLKITPPVPPDLALHLARLYRQPEGSDAER